MSTNNSLITIGNLNGDFIVKEGSVGLNPEVKGEKGDKGDKGERGDGLQIGVTFVSAAEMEAVVAEYPEGTVAMISTPDTNDVDNSKIYVKRVDVWGFINDLSGAVGLQGPAGENGVDGAPGEPGVAGQDGAPGKDGINGVDGANGKSAYEVWLTLGNTGSEQDFINSLKGEPGAGAGGDTVTYPLIAHTDIAGNYLGSMIDAQGVTEIVAPLTGFDSGTAPVTRTEDPFSTIMKDTSDVNLDKILFCLFVTNLVTFDISEPTMPLGSVSAYSQALREMWNVKTLSEKRAMAEFQVGATGGQLYREVAKVDENMGSITPITLVELELKLDGGISRTGTSRQILVDYGINVSSPAQ